MMKLLRDPVGRRRIVEHLHVILMGGTDRYKTLMAYDMFIRGVPPFYFYGSLYEDISTHYRQWGRA